MYYMKILLNIELLNQILPDYSDNPIKNANIGIADWDLFLYLWTYWNNGLSVYYSDQHVPEHKLVSG